MCSCSGHLQEQEQASQAIRAIQELEVRVVQLPQLIENANTELQRIESALEEKYASNDSFAYFQIPTNHPLFFFIS